MTTETQDVDLILSQALKMNMHEVPSFCSFRVNNTTLESPRGSTASGKSPTYQTATNLSEHIAKQVPCQSDSYSKQELNVRTLWPDIKMMVSSSKLMVHFATAISVSQSDSRSHLKDRESGKRFAPLWAILAAKLKVLFPEGDDTGTFIVPALDVRSQVLSIKDRRNGVGKPVFKLAPFGNGQVFAFTAPDLHVPGIPDDALQLVISQASHLAQDRTANV